MEVEYQLTLEDLYAFQWRAAYASPISRRMQRRTYLYLFLTFLLIALLPSIGSCSFSIARINLIFLVVVFPIVAGIYWLLQRYMLRRAIRDLVRREKPDRGQLGTHRIALGGEGLVETTAIGETRTAWVGVDRIEQNDDYIFIYVSAASAHVIPKRAFSGTQADEFHELAIRRKREAEADRSMKVQ